MEKDILVLAVESSCDETSVAVIKNGTEILSNVVASQIESHKRFGGVVPEVASRHHVESVTLVFEEALKVANVTWDDIDAITVTEGPGLIGSLLKKLVMSTPKRLITVVVVLAGVLSSIASDAGYVVLIPLGAIIFLSMGRHPIAGLAAAFAGVSGGFSANVMVGPTDSLLAGLTTEGAKLADPNYVVEMTGNWWFLIASTVLITVIGTIVTEKIVEPRLGKCNDSF